FPVGESAGADGLGSAATAARAVIDAADRARVEACITIVGHADETGTRERNLEIAEERAAWTASALAQRGLPEAALRHAGEGVWLEARSRARARSATFRVQIGARCTEAR